MPSEWSASLKAASELLEEHRFERDVGIELEHDIRALWESRHPCLEGDHVATAAPTVAELAGLDVCARG